MPNPPLQRTTGAGVLVNEERDGTVRRLSALLCEPGRSEVADRYGGPCVHHPGGGGSSAAT